MYYKIIGDRPVFSDCKVLEVAPRQWVSNPPEELIFQCGWQVFVPPPTPPQTEPYEDEIIAAVKRMLSSSVEEMTDEQALDVAALFPTWTSKMGAEVTAGERLWDDGELWKALQPHTVQANWRPKDSPSLFVRVTIEQWPAWVQPVGATDAYRLNAQVSHNDKHWISEIDYNTYEPGVYGWREA